MFRFNQHRDKTPFGAVREKTEVSFVFGVRQDVGAKAVHLVMRRGEKSTEYAMSLAEQRQEYDYYMVRFTPSRWGIFYYRFEVETDQGILFVGRDAAGDAICGDFLPEWQLTVYSLTAREAGGRGDEIAYHIFVDRFARAEIPYDHRLDALPPRIYKEWDDDVDIVGKDGAPYNANDFFGGNLRGIISRLDYLKSLGVTVLFLSPVFLSVSNHRYDTGDYTQIDPLLGTEEDFAALVEAAKAHGMRIMLDGVFNHTGSDSIYFNRDGHFDSVGAYQGGASPYRDWFHIHRDGTYDCWWGIQNVPTINKRSKSARQYLFGEDGVVAHWSRYDIDWRLDVVDELPDFYLDELCACIRRANPNGNIIGEVWEDASTKCSYGVQRHYFTEGQLDGVMNYVFRNAIRAYATGGSADDFANAVMDICENYPRHALDHSLTLLDSHDTVRILNELAMVNTTGWSKQMMRDYRLTPQQRRLGMDRLLVAATLQFMLPGTPTIYYGDEVGLTGFTDPINRRPYPWDNPNKELRSFYTRLGEVRHRIAQSLAGAIRFSNREGVMVMLRGEEDHQVAVCANTTLKPHGLRLYNRCQDLLTGRVWEGNVFMYVNSVMVLKPLD
jgi:glycosidase